MNKKIFWSVFAVIVLGAIFLRTWNYSEWLYFKWDQGRDSTMLAKAVDNGPGELPLLGPRAARVGADYLRLGPAYYYFQYLPAGLLNSTHPTAFSYADLIMSILTIPLLYAFSRLYFSKKHSFVITALYSSCFLVVQYSRFAWNPNSVPLFMLLTFYGMIRFVQSKKLKNQIKWLALWAFGFSLASQLHFYAMFSLIAISGIFFIYHFNLFQLKKLPFNLKKTFSKNNLKVFGVALGVIVITNLPMIISEFKTDASNLRVFPEAVTKKADEDKDFKEKLYRNFEEYSNFNYLMLTSFENKTGKKADKIPMLIGFIAMLSGIVLAIYFYRKETHPTKKAFLFLIPLWVGILFFLTIGASYGLRPRYFVPIFPLPFITIGLILVFIEKKWPKNSDLIGYSLFVLILLFNLNGIKDWFVENKLSQTQAIETRRNHILKKDDGITLGQFERIVDHILKNTSEKEKKILIWTKAEYKQPLKYLLLRQRPKTDWDFVNKSKELYGNSSMIAINTVNGDYDSVTKDIRQHTTVESRAQFGQLMFLKLKINPEKILEPEKKENKADNDNEDTGRVYWKDIL